MTITRPCKRPFRGHSIITPSLDFNHGIDFNTQGNVSQTFKVLEHLRKINKFLNFEKLFHILAKIWLLGEHFGLRGSDWEFTDFRSIISICNFGIFVSWFIQSQPWIFYLPLRKAKVKVLKDAKVTKPKILHAFSQFLAREKEHVV